MAEDGTSYHWRLIKVPAVSIVVPVFKSKPVIYSGSYKLPEKGHTTESLGLGALNGVKL